MNISFTIDPQKVALRFIMLSNLEHDIFYRNYWQCPSKRIDNKAYRFISKSHLDYLYYLNKDNTLTSLNFSTPVLEDLIGTLFIINYCLYKVTTICIRDTEFIALEYISKYKKNSDVFTVDDIVYKVLGVQNNYLKLEPL